MKTGNDTLQTPLLVARGTPLVPGKTYLRLCRGRTNPDQEMGEWGFTGPTFGPLSRHVHIYCQNFRIYGEVHTNEIRLETHGDTIRWNGCFYGDLEVFLANPNDRG